MNPLSSSFTPSQASTSALNPEAALFEPVESPCQTPTLHSPAGCTPSERKSSAPSTPTLNQEQRGHLLPESIQQQQILRVCRACIDGQLGSLQTIIQPGSPSAFELVNSAHPHTGLLPLHYAASRGYLHIVSYLLEQGAMLLEDPSGETPLHVAAYKGHAAVLECLISSASDSNAVNAADSDGWQPLHNACSRGWLDIVQMLVANGALPDQESNLGYTPLMNAASKGHLPIINFLISKGLADPFKRNKNGEAAYDTASASEPFVCEVLAAYEAKLWEKRMSEVPEADALPYNPLYLHVNVVVMLHENQRLDLRLTSFGYRANFTSAALTKSDARSPFTLPSSCAGINATRLHLPVYRSDLGLPTVQHPFQVVIPPLAHAYVDQHDKERDRRTPRAFRSLSGSSFRTNASESSYFAAASARDQQQNVTRNTERSHFWITDWFIDLSSPTVDPSDGWEYSTSFDAPDKWTSEPPPELRRLMEQPGLAISGSTKWVRRRRWARVMRRRLDRPALPFADLDGAEAIRTSGDGAASHFSSNENGPASPSSSDNSNLPRTEADYVARARYTAGVGHRLGSRADPTHSDDISFRSGGAFSTVSQHHADALSSKVEARRLILRLESAITELRQGLLSDEDLDRIQQAQALLETYVRRLEEIKLKAGDEIMQEEEEQQEEEFIYRSQDVPEEESQRTPNGSVRAATSESPSITINRAPALDQDLRQATAFRVPSREAPVMRSSSSRSVPVAVPIGPQWQPDEEATHCSRCNSTFTIFRRKHHCRRCGKVVCASCSNNFDALEPCDVVIDSAALHSVSSLQRREAVHRTCNACHSEIAGRLQSPGEYLGGVPFDSELLSTIVPPLQTPGSPLSSSVSSQTSVLQECPACGLQLTSLGNQADQEEHVRRCLEEGRSIAHSQRYLVFKLGQSPLVGTDCVICFEELALNDEVARLPCLCFYHRRCIAAWMARDRGCPVHAR